MPWTHSRFVTVQDLQAADAPAAQSLAASQLLSAAYGRSGLYQIAKTVCRMQAFAVCFCYLVQVLNSYVHSTTSFRPCKADGRSSPHLSQRFFMKVTGNEQKKRNIATTFSCRNSWYMLYYCQRRCTKYGAERKTDWKAVLLKHDPDYLRCL